MKRLLEEPDASLDALTRLLEGAEPVAPSPFAKHSIKARLSRAPGSPIPTALRPALLGAGGLLIAATAAAAAGYSWLSPSESVPPASSAAPAAVSAAPSASAPPPEPAAVDEAPSVVDEHSAVADEAPAAAASVSPAAPKRQAEKPRPGEDPTQVAEAVRALRKQGDHAQALALLEQYLKTNPRGALAEDALALSIEAAAARKDPRAADYARRYLARYPNGRFRAVAERVLSR